MAIEALELIIGKAPLEASFRAALPADPDQALAGFDLTRAEGLPSSAWTARHWRPWQPISMSKKRNCIWKTSGKPEN